MTQQFMKMMTRQLKDDLGVPNVKAVSTLYEIMFIVCKYFGGVFYSNRKLQ